MYLRAVLVVICVATIGTRTQAQSWEGNVNGTKLTVSGQSGGSSPASFKVYFGGTPEGSVLLRCGHIYVDTGTVLFCSHNLNEYADQTLTIRNYFNFRFSSSNLSYVCEAATNTSPLFCHVRAGNSAASRPQEFRLNLVH
jgi:hypothetical protein